MQTAKATNIAVFVLRLLLAALFLTTGTHKLLGDPMTVRVFDKIGLGQGIRYVTGVIEIACALFLLWPRTSRFAALGILCVLLGAFAAQLFILHGDVIHLIVITAVLLLMSWLQRIAY